MIKLIAVDMDGTFLRDDKTYYREKFARIYQELEKKVKEVIRETKLCVIK